MGADLSGAPAGRSPSFLVAALKDPYKGGNLDRIQIVKGWVDEDGKIHENIYNVAWGDSDLRALDADGRVSAVGNTVDLETATWTNTIGDPQLVAVWQDPDFHPMHAAVYYARVLEIPKPRWTAYDAVYYGVKMDPEIPMIQQERVWTSPIWYTPEN